MVELEYFVTGPDGRRIHRITAESGAAIEYALSVREIEGCPVECVHAHLIDEAGSILLRPIPPEWYRDGIPSWWRARVSDELQLLFAPYNALVREGDSC